MTAAVPDAMRAGTIDALRAAGARFALLHGSRVTGTHRLDSDVDVAAWWAGGAPPAFEVDVPFDDDPPARVRWVATTRKIYADEQPGCSAAIASSSKASDVVDEVRVLRLLRSVTDDLAVLRDNARPALRPVRSSSLRHRDCRVDLGRQITGSAVSANRR